MRWVIAILILIATCSCSRKVVDRIEATDTLYVTSIKHDSIYIERETIRIDSVVIHDSIIVTKNSEGDITGIEKYYNRESSKEREITQHEANVATADSSLVSIQMDEEHEYVPPGNNIILIKGAILLGFIIGMLACWGILKLFKE